MNRTQNGFSLIEVLVTILLVSIGLLGMVALQGRTIAYTQDSVQRNAAAMLADDLLELIRAKPGDEGFYKRKTDEFPDKPDSCAPMPQAASDQLGCWAARVKSALPDAESLFDEEYIVEKKAGDIVEIQIAWRVKSGECLSNNGDNEEPDDELEEEPPTTAQDVCRYTLLTRLPTL